MKKITLLLILTAVILNVFSFDASSQGPCTYPDFEIVEAIPYPDCPDLEIRLCISCNPASAQVDIRILGFNGICDPALIPAYIDFSQSIILANAMYYCIFGWIPCDQGSTRAVLKTPLCFMEDDLNPGDFVSCNNSYCVKEFDICSENGQDIWTLVGTPYIEGTLICAPILWSPGLPPGTCFRLNLDCP